MPVIPAWCFDSIVTLGQPRQHGAQPLWFGTGAVVRRVTAGDVGEVTRYFLVTARHVATHALAVAPTFYAAFPDNHAIAVPSAPGAVSRWRYPGNAEVDIAVLELPANTHANIGASFDLSANTARVAWLAANDVREGIECFVITGLTGSHDTEIATIYGNERIARRATIAHNRETLLDIHRPMRLDGFVWNGSSGAPLVFVNIDNQNEPQARLIGIVANYVPYPDLATALNDDAKVKVVFNSGIFTAYAIDSSLDIIEAW